jgi:eukaryotic-like serine/threonine-protein kinase
VIGQRFGAYEITAHLGTGGMGEVYRARDARLGRDVAIKLLPEAFSRDASRLARFDREARALGALNHPNIGAIYGLEDDHDRRGLVLELVEGQTLADVLASRGALGLPIADVIGIARQIADALEAAHEKGIIHRDLKPANVKLTPAGTIKVIDFGLAKSDAGRSATQPTVTIARDATAEGLVVGTPRYMSPEQARGEAVGAQTDIWAFGCMLFELLSARPAFKGTSGADALVACSSLSRRGPSSPTRRRRRWDACFVGASRRSYATGCITSPMRGSISTMQ